MSGVCLNKEYFNWLTLTGGTVGQSGVSQRSSRPEPEGGEGGGRPLLLKPPLFCVPDLVT